MTTDDTTRADEQAVERRCEAIVPNTPPPFALKRCGALIVEQRQWKHRDPGRDEWIWVCTADPPHEQEAPDG